MTYEEIPNSTRRTKNKQRPTDDMLQRLEAVTEISGNSAGTNTTTANTLSIEIDSCILEIGVNHRIDITHINAADNSQVVPLAS